MSNSIENYDFKNLIMKYDLKDYIILIIYKDKDEIKLLSKINLNNSLKVNNQKYSKVDLNKKMDFELILQNLKKTYEDHWKKINEINTSIKLPLTLSISSKNYKKILELEEMFSNIDLISNFYILKFDNQNTIYKIIYNGSPKTFFNSVTAQNFELIMEENIWKIK